MSTTEEVTTRTVNPLADRIAVKIQETDEFVGSVFIPENARSKSQTGIVISVGPGLRDENGDYIPVGIEVGSEVIFPKYSGSEVEIDGEEILILRESDVLGIVCA